MGNDELEVSFEELTTISHEMLNGKLYGICYDIVSLARRIGSKNQRAMSILYINKILCTRDSPDRPLQDRTSEVEKMISTGKWVEGDPVIDLAIACLKQDFDDIRKLTEAAIKDGLSIHDASSFYVFEEARQEHCFLKLFSARNADFRKFLRT
jgi:hypothetical protein